MLDKSFIHHPAFSAEAGHSLLQAYAAITAELVTDGSITQDHLEETPGRIVKALHEMFSGLGYRPQDALTTDFAEHAYDQMILVVGIEFTSVCAHHFLPFVGRAHFGYIPQKKVVGLSKIPRLIDILARRPQIQEKLTREIVDIFQEVVDPLGCGVVLEAWHSCMGVRGVRKPDAMMRTTALAGKFLTAPHVKAEFLGAVPRTESK